MLLWHRDEEERERERCHLYICNFVSLTGTNQNVPSIPLFQVFRGKNLVVVKRTGASGYWFFGSILHLFIVVF